MSQRTLKCFTVLLYGAAAVGAAWLALRFLLPWTAPFLLAFAFAALAEPLVSALHRRGLPRGAAAGLVSLAALALLLWGLGALASRGAAALSGLIGALPERAEALGGALTGLEEKLLRTAGDSVYLKTALDAVRETLYRIPAAVSQRLLGLLTRLAQSSPDLLLFLVTAGIGAYFISAAYPRFLAFLRAQLPERLRLRLAGLEQDLKQSFGGWLRAQLIMMLITFFELLAAFLLLRIRGAALAAAATALIDALPVFGTGAVLVPWALASLLLGETARGLGLLICWGVVSLVRSCIQAKLVGDQIGLDPIASLLAVYAGWRVCGVWGTLCFPILLVTLQRLNDKGVLRLWNKA